MYMHGIINTRWSALYTGLNQLVLSSPGVVLSLLWSRRALNLIVGGEPKSELGGGWYIGRA